MLLSASPEARLTAATIIILMYIMMDVAYIIFRFGSICRTPTLRI